jgi:hypothetical protein
VSGGHFELEDTIKCYIYTINLVKVLEGKLAQRKLCQSYHVYTIKVSIPSYLLAVNSKINNRSWFRKDVLNGQFPSKDFLKD